MLREIINPSDPVLIDVSDLKAAALAVVVLGEGFYGLSLEDGDMPMVAFAPDLIDDWSHERFGCSFREMQGDLTLERVASALDTVQIEGGAEATSMNDIVGRAKLLAKAYRDEAGGE